MSFLSWKRCLIIGSLAAVCLSTLPGCFFGPGLGDNSEPPVSEASKDDASKTVKK